MEKILHQVYQYGLEKLNHHVQIIGKLNPLLQTSKKKKTFSFKNFRSTQTIVADVPQFSAVMPSMPWIQRPISTPISLVRRDGVVYLTPLVFTYTPQPAPPPARKNSPTPETILPPTSDNNFCE